MIQSVISRMASNSASCKTWCVTLVTALFALAIDKNKPAAILIGLFPLALFCFLDAYYLSLERDFIVFTKNSSASFLITLWLQMHLSSLPQTLVFCSGWASPPKALGRSRSGRST